MRHLLSAVPITYAFSFSPLAVLTIRYLAATTNFWTTRTYPNICGMPVDMRLFLQEHPLPSYLSTISFSRYKHWAAVSRASLYLT